MDLPRAFLWPTLLVGALALVARGQDTPADALEAVQGTWRLVGLEQNGKAVAQSDLPSRTIFFGANQFVISGRKGPVQAGTFVIDPGAPPKSITMLVMQGEEVGRTLLGIYEIDKDTLKICLDTKGRHRPTEMKTGDQSDRALITYKRQPAPGDQGPDITGDYTEETPDMQGNMHRLDVTITRRGDSYQVTWKNGPLVAYVGTGMRHNDVFTVCWISQGQVGLSVYQIGKGPKLTGHYTMMGGPGHIVPETLTAKQPNAGEQAESPAAPRKPS